MNPKLPISWSECYDVIMHQTGRDLHILGSLVGWIVINSTQITTVYAVACFKVKISNDCQLKVPGISANSYSSVAV